MRAIKMRLILRAFKYLQNSKKFDLRWRLRVRWPMPLRAGDLGPGLRRQFS